MKVKEIIDLLSGVDPESEVILSSDGEGNSYSPAWALNEVHYTPLSTWGGEIDNEEEPHPDGNNAVVIWPTN